MTGRPTTTEQKGSFPPQLGLLGTNLGQIIFFKVSALQDVRHCPKLQYCAISRKTNDVIMRKWQKSWFRARFQLVWPKFEPVPPSSPPPKNRCSTLLQAITICNWRETIDSTSRKCQKSHFGPDLGLLGPNSDCNFFF